MIAAALFILLGGFGVWVSYRLGLRSGSSASRTIACLIAVFVSLGAVFLGLGLIANSGDIRYLG